MSPEILASSTYWWEVGIPQLSIDCVLFSFFNNDLQILLLKTKEMNEWQLPGGYIKKEESVEAAVTRILYERSGAKDIFMHSFGVFGDLNRSEHAFENYPDTLWHKQRFITLGYYALVDYSKVTPTADEYSTGCEWFPLNNLPAIAMDHKHIIQTAHNVIREQIGYKPLGYNLLPEVFTMPELQSLYEAILGQKLNRGNFYRKIMRFKILEQLQESRKGGAHKAPNLYRFDKEVYYKLLGGINWT